MSSSFDPYHKWLGIAPKDQPPNHYRLLGIDLFESDPDVIGQAADQRMAHLRSFQNGPNGPLSQRLLNELSAAKICLLKPKSRTAYDESLRAAEKQALAAKPMAAALTATDTGTVPFAQSLELAEATDFAVSSGRRTIKKKATRKPFQWFLPGLAILVLACVAGYLANSKEDKIALPPHSPHNGNQQVTRQSNVPVPLPVPRPIPPPSVPAASERPAETSVAMEVGQEPAPDDSKRSGPHGRSDDEPLDDSSGDATASPEPANGNSNIPVAVVSDQVAAGKFPIPAANAMRQAERLANEVFKADYQQAKTPAKKQDLIGKILEQAKGSQEGSAERYVLITKAKDVAVNAGDVTAALQAIDALNKFEVDSLALKVAALSSIAKGSLSPAQQRMVAVASLELLDQDAADDKYDLGTQLCALALRTAQKAKDAALVKKVVERQKDFAATAKAYAAMASALEKLDQSPDDPDANLLVGRFRCLVKGDWEQGLPLLAVGSDEQLKSLAERDKAAPDSPEEQARLGDGWWDQIRSADPTAKQNLQIRAAYWYRQALPGLTGLSKAKIEKRLTELPDSEVDSKSGSKHRYSLPDGALVLMTFDKNTLSKKVGGALQVRDQSGHGNHGTVVGAAYLEHGKVGGALDFNGTDSHIDIPLPKETTLNQKTFAAWVLLHDLKQRGGGVLGVTRGQGQPFDSIVYNERGEGWLFGSENFLRTVHSQFIESKQEWVHVAATYDDDRSILYRNGKPIATLRGHKLMSFVDGPVIVIGRRCFGDGGNLYLNAAIDEVAVFSRALSEQEISNLFRIGESGQSIAPD